MRYWITGFASISILAAGIIAASKCAIAKSTPQTTSARITSTATIIKPAIIYGSMRILTTDTFVSGMTGDLMIRIATAVIMASENEGSDMRKEPETGLLGGNPVNSIGVITPDTPPIETSVLSSNTSDADQASLANVNVIIAYN